MEQFNQEQLYGVVIQTMTAASQLPMVKVNREEFLKTRFKDSPYLDKIIADGPTAVFTTKALRKEAEKIINDMTTKTSLISFAAGLPGNPFTAVAAGTADIAQYFGFALNLSQQIAYLFGEDELFVGEGKEISEEVQIRIIAYIGVMFRAGGSAVLLNKVSKTVGANIGKKVAMQAL
nr:ABC transporter ATPase [Streptococcus suis]